MPKATKQFKTSVRDIPPPTSEDTGILSGENQSNTLPLYTESRIAVLRNYSGRRTGEQWILKGIYSKEDPALYGLADYLVENGHAEELD